MHRYLRISRALATFTAIAALASFPDGAVLGQVILNISGTGNNHTGNPLFVNLSLGAYKVDVLSISQGGLYDAYSPWESTSCENSAGCSPMAATGWYTAYQVISPNITSVTVAENQVLPGPNLGEDYRRDFFYRSLSFAVYGAFDGVVLPNTQLALSHRRSSTFAVDAAGPVGFALRDGPGFFDDNRGGLSLRITPIPEPTATVLAIVPLATFLSISRPVRRNRA